MGFYIPYERARGFWGDVKALIATYNQKLYIKHRVVRTLELDKGHVFIKGYEEDTVAIVKNSKNMLLTD